MTFVLMMIAFAAGIAVGHGPKATVAWIKAKLASLRG